MKGYDCSGFLKLLPPKIMNLKSGKSYLEVRL